MVPVVDPKKHRRGGGARNMKYRPPCAAVIHFYDYFYSPPASLHPVADPGGVDPLLDAVSCGIMGGVIRSLTGRDT